MEFYEWYMKQKRRQRLTMKDMAERLCCSRNHLNQIVIGNRPPSYKLAKAIESFTEGAVTIPELMEQKSVLFEGPLK